MVDPYASEQTTHLPQLDLPTEVISDKSWLWFNEHIGPSSAVRPDVMRNMAAHYYEFGRKLREIAGRLRFRASIHADNWRGADARASQQAFRQLHGTANALAETSQQIWLALTSMAGTAEQVQQEMIDDQTYLRVDYFHLKDRRPDDADADRARQRFIMLMESYSDAIETQMPRSVSSNIPPALANPGSYDDYSPLDSQSAGGAYYAPGIGGSGYSGSSGYSGGDYSGAGVDNSPTPGFDPSQFAPTHDGGSDPSDLISDVPGHGAWAGPDPSTIVDPGSSSNSGSALGSVGSDGVWGSEDGYEPDSSLAGFDPSSLGTGGAGIGGIGADGHSGSVGPGGIGAGGGGGGGASGGGPTAGRPNSFTPSPSFSSGGTGTPGRAGSGGMMPPMGAGGGGKDKDRERDRLAWLPEDRGVWDTSDLPSAPPVIGDTDDDRPPEERPRRRPRQRYV